MKFLVKLLCVFIPFEKLRHKLKDKYLYAYDSYKKSKEYKSLFEKIENKRYQKILTKKFLNFVEIEVFSFCNRTCWFCPNSKIDRHGQNIFMPEDTYLKILKDLKEIKYDGLVTFSRYNEPLADKIILTRIAQARKYLPNAFLSTNTNGDYLTKEYIEKLVESGLNFLAIQCYLGQDEIFDIEKVVKPKMQKIIDKLDLDYEVATHTETGYSIVFKYPKMHIHLSALDFMKEGVNRGESIDTIKGIDRVNPCLSPFYRIYIDYDGSIMPCCQVRHDVDSHKHLISGHINKNDIFEIFTGEKFSSIRKHLEGFGKKMSPCSTCNATVTTEVLAHKGGIIFEELRKQKKGLKWKIN